MNRAIQKAQDFTKDFETLFSWYLDRADEEVVWKFQAALDLSLIKLARQPDLGRPRYFHHAKLKGLRSYPVEPPSGKILIFYRANDEKLDAVRLMHGARNLPRRLREPPL